MSMQYTNRSVPRLLALSLIVLGLVIPTIAAAARTQADSDIGFVLVALVPPEEWVSLAATYPQPDASATPRVSGTPVAPARGLLRDGDLVDALRGGGYVLYFRHARTDFSQTDADRQNLEDCATRRNLSDVGRADAHAIGEAIRQLGIPIGDVLASEYCRTRQTAEFMFGAARVTPTRDLTSRASTGTEAERRERIEALRRLLATPPAPGTNTVLVGHLFNLEDATGVTIVEGEAAIFLPVGVPAAGTPDSVGIMTTDPAAAIEYQTVRLEPSRSSS